MPVKNYVATFGQFVIVAMCFGGGVFVVFFSIIIVTVIQFIVGRRKGSRRRMRKSRPIFSGWYAR